MYFFIICHGHSFYIQFVLFFLLLEKLSCLGEHLFVFFCFKAIIYSADGSDFAACLLSRKVSFQ